MFTLQKRFSRLTAGFTLTELLVTISIVALIMVVVLYSYSMFNDRLSLTAATQEMAIALRQTQSYGINVRQVASGGGNFTSAYGFFVDPLGDPTHYTVFVDSAVNKKYDVGTGVCGVSTTECIEKFTLRNGVTISSICNLSGTTCPPDPSVQTLHVTFLRPNPDADINFVNSGGTIWNGSQAGARITLRSSKGSTAQVVIESTGQVYVN